VVTLGIMIATCSPRQTLAGAPGELSINRRPVTVETCPWLTRRRPGS
jgi:hypothetical protein